MTSIVSSVVGSAQLPSMNRQSPCWRGFVVARALMSGVSLGVRCLDGDGQVLDAAVGERAQSLDGPDHLERAEAHEEVTEDGLDLDAGEVRAHAEGLAEPEREVRIGLAIDAELERLVEH